MTYATYLQQIILNFENTFLLKLKFSLITFKNKIAKNKVQRLLCRTSWRKTCLWLLQRWSWTAITWQCLCKIIAVVMDYLPSVAKNKHCLWNRWITTRIDDESIIFVHIITNISSNCISTLIVPSQTLQLDQHAQTLLWDKLCQSCFYSLL